MMTVLLKEWCETGLTSEGGHKEEIFEAARVEYYPAGAIHVAKPALKIITGNDEIMMVLDAAQTAFVMNSAGKTVARYVGGSAPKIASAEADQNHVNARSWELRPSDVEAAIAAQVPC